MESEGLTDLQLAVMRALWQVSEGTVAEILAAMASAGRELATTTVATLLQRLRQQGWVPCRKRGRSASLGGARGLALLLTYVLHGAIWAEARAWQQSE